jgi:hypothetical protein
LPVVTATVSDVTPTEAAARVGDRSRGAPTSADTLAAMNAELAAMLSLLGDLTDAAEADAVEGDREVDAVRIDAVALLERVQAAAAATQAALSVGFARSQVTTHHRALLRDPRAVGRGIADQLALACRVSPFEGRDGSVWPGRCTPSCPPRPICAMGRSARPSRGWSSRRHGTWSPVGGAQSTAGWRVSVRPAPDTMSVLSGFLPVEQGVACWAALRTHADSVRNVGDLRSRTQIMADTLVERLTGQTAAADVQAEMAIVMPVGALIAPDAGSITGGHTPTSTRPPDHAAIR